MPAPAFAISQISVLPARTLASILYMSIFLPLMVKRPPPPMVSRSKRRDPSAVLTLGNPLGKLHFADYLTPTHA